MKETKLLTLATVLAIVLSLAVPLAFAAPAKPQTVSTIAGYQIVESAPLNFSGSGWGGWSCPAGKVVLGGGVAGIRTQTSRPAGPNSVWPHYTYGPNEYGWVAQAAEAGTAKIWVVCADAPAGYGIIESAGLNFNAAGGWGGWSCPAGKVVLGGGVQDLLARTSRAAGPASVWPHYTYGPNEYGWVAQNAGAATTGSKIAVVCADPVAGHQIVESAPQNYGPYGAAGWSCPAGKLVTGGGVQNLVARSSRPAGPGTVTDFGYTYGPAEYGWLANNGENAGTSGSLIVPVCAAAPSTAPSVTTTTDKTVFCGETAKVTINLNDVVNMYGYQFKVHYDASKVTTASGAFVDSFFDSRAPAIRPWDATCAAGVCQFAVSHVDPQTAISGSGPVAEITFAPGTPGEFDLTVSDILLSDRDGMPTSPAAPAPLHLTVCGFASVSGVVSLQGRATPIDAGAVTLTDGVLGPYSAGFDPGTGAYSISNIKVMPGGTSYQFDAAHGLYLGNRMSHTLNPGDTYAAPATRLKGGDADNSGLIDVSDLTCIGGAFGCSRHLRYDRQQRHQQGWRN